MPEPIKMERTRIQERVHRIHIACQDKGRSEPDLLHRFIAQLRLPNFQIEQVKIQEELHSAKIVFRDLQSPHTDSHGFSSLFKRKRFKPESKLRLNLELYKLDAKGLNFFMDYAFEARSRHTSNTQELGLTKNVHAMIQTAFEDYPSFSISQMPDVEVT